MCKLCNTEELSGYVVVYDIMLNIVMYKLILSVPRDFGMCSCGLSILFGSLFRLCFGGQWKMQVGWRLNDGGTELENDPRHTKQEGVNRQVCDAIARACAVVCPSTGKPQ